MNSSPRRCTHHVIDTLSFHLTMPAVSLSTAVQDTTPVGVLSQWGCTLTLPLTTSIGIWQGAGVTKRGTSHASHRGIWHGAGATKSWLYSVTLKKSFALIKRCVKAIEIFYLDDSRNAQRWQWHTNWRYKKINPADWKVRCGYSGMLVNWICLCFSLLLCSRTLTQVVVDLWFKIEESLHEMAISY